VSNVAGKIWKIKKNPKKNGAFWKKHGTKWWYSSPA
jgi:hypothetical protein